MLRHLKNHLSVILLIIICFIFPGCSKKEQITDSPKLLWNVLPSDTASFYLLDGSKFKDSSITIDDLMDIISNIEITDSSKFHTVKTSLLKVLQLIPKGRLAEYISGFITYTSDTQVGVCLAPTNKEVALKLYSDLQKIQNENNFAIVANQKSDRIFVRFSVTPTNEILTEMSVNACLTKDKTNFDLDQTLSGQLLKPETFAIGNFTVQKDLNIPSQSRTISTNDLPINSFQVIQSLDKTYKLQVIAPLSPKSVEQSRLVELLEKSTSQKNLTSGSFPGITEDASIAVTFSNWFLSGIIDAAKAQSSVDQAKTIQSLKSLLEFIDSVSLSVTQGSNDAIFPDIAFSFNSRNADKLHDLLKAEIQKLVSSQVPMSNWFEKETSSVRFNYVQSPLGVGVYIASNSDNVFVSSSESGLINIANPNASKLDKELSNRGFRLPTSTSLFSAYASAPRVAALIDNIQSTLSLFTGGDSTLNNQQLGFLKSMSIGTLSVYSKDKVLNLEVDILPKATAQNP